VPDHRDAEGVASRAANTRVASITGIVLGIIPVLSPIGLIVSFVAFFGYRRTAAKPTLAIIGIVVSALVLAGSLVYLLLPGGPLSPN